MPRDIVELRVRDKLSTDMRVGVLKTSTLRVKWTLLTVEVMPILKGTTPNIHGQL